LTQARHEVPRGAMDVMAALQGLQPRSVSTERGTAQLGQTLEQNVVWDRHVNYIEAAGHVNELLFRGGASHWTDTDLTGANGSLAASGGALDGYVDSGGNQHVNYIDAGGHIHELSYAGQWVNNVLPGIAAA